MGMILGTERGSVLVIGYLLYDTILYEIMMMNVL